MTRHGRRFPIRSVTINRQRLTAATAYTLPANTGSFTLTGVAAGLRATRTLPCTVGTYTLTGNSANLLHGYKVVCTVGTFNLTGQAANLLYGHKLTATVGTFTLTGIAAGLARTRVIQCSVGIYTLTGVNANLLFGHKNVETVGVFTLTGNPANLLYSKAPLAAGTGSFTLTGQAAAFTRTRVLQATTVAYVLTGVGATLVPPVPVAPERPASSSGGGGSGGGKPTSSRYQGKSSGLPWVLPKDKWTYGRKPKIEEWEGNEYENSQDYSKHVVEPDDEEVLLVLSMLED